MAEVEYDPVTYEIRPVHVTAVQEIGRALNPTLVAGQIEGGTVQGIGYALLEEVVMRDGRMANAQLTNYIVPTTMDAPRIDVVIMENRYRHGPFGAKGVGELPFDGARAGDRERGPSPRLRRPLAADDARAGDGGQEDRLRQVAQ